MCIAIADKADTFFYQRRIEKLVYDVINRPNFGGDCVEKYWSTTNYTCCYYRGEYKEPKNMSFELFSEGPLYGRGFNLCSFNNNL
jgi:hypothetical protein